MVPFKGDGAFVRNSLAVRQVKETSPRRSRRSTLYGRPLHSSFDEACSGRAELGVIPWQLGLIGGVAGSIGDGLVHPIDVVKTRLIVCHLNRVPVLNVPDSDRARGTHLQMTGRLVLSAVSVYCFFFFSCVTTFFTALLWIIDCVYVGLCRHHRQVQVLSAVWPRRCGGSRLGRWSGAYPSWCL